jgi:GMP synthase-like glutamine amidotransferase
MRFHCLQHIEIEEPAYIKDWINQNGHSLTLTKFFENEELQLHSAYDILLIMGGPMGAYDEDIYPWLRKEKIFIKEAIGLNKKVIGICLGSQLLAAAIGSKVYPNKEKEIGFFPIKKVSNHKVFDGFPDSAMVFHWHGDTFDLPKNSQLIFSSEVCTNQAFICNDNVLGLQFHIEITEQLIQSWLIEGGDEFDKNDYTQSKESIIEGLKYIPTCNLLLDDLLTKFLSL